MRRKKNENIEQDIELEIGQDVRKILDGESVRDIEEESGPQLYPGMTDAGIGSELDRTRIYGAGPAPGADVRYSSEYDERSDRSRRYGTGYDERDDRSRRYDAGYDERSDRFRRYDAGYDEADGEYGGYEGDHNRKHIDDYGDDYEGEYEDKYVEDEGGELPPPKRKQPRPYLIIAVSFGLLFLFLSAHLIYFNVRMKDEILSSPYNRRQNAQADLVRRGSILSADGATLARTDTYDGTEERVYPYANIFAHAVGFITHGKSGIESFANYELLTSHTNIIDQMINEFRKKKSDGDNVVTTLNAKLQEAAYYALGDYRGAVICMNPKTGAILAMVSKPNFDPNTLAEIWDEMVADSSNSNLVNRATQGLYPPGSTFKIVTALAYYKRHHTFDGFHFNCTGEFTVDDYTVHCYKGTVHGEEDFKSAFAHSCNTAFSRIGLDLGAGNLSGTALSLMFGESLPCELLSSKSRWSLANSPDDVELVQTAFGQGKTLVTPYHMALLVSAIANDGVLMTPHLIDHTESAAGDLVKKTKPSVYRRLVTHDEAEALSSLMQAVVEEGSASELSGRSYRVAGKTGSAEYTKSSGEIGTHSWFVGFTNPGDSEFAIAVIAENGGAGSSTAVPIASEILSQYYGW